MEGIEKMIVKIIVKFLEKRWFWGEFWLVFLCYMYKKSEKKKVVEDGFFMERECVNKDRRVVVFLF